MDPDQSTLEVNSDQKSALNTQNESLDTSKMQLDLQTNQDSSKTSDNNTTQLKTPDTSTKSPNSQYSNDISQDSSKISRSSSKMKPIEALSIGLLAQFRSLKDLETQLEQIVENQKSLIENMITMNNFYTQNEELMEVTLMMKKMNLYRMKLKKIRSDMLYIRSTSQSLLQKAIELQNIKVNQKAEKVKRFDYEISLIAKSKSQQ